MKKFIKPHMKRPIIEKFFTRILIALVLGMIYNALILKKVAVNATFFNYPLLTIGAICIALGWFNYLRFDGIRINLEIDQENREKKFKKKKKHKTKQMIDYTDEGIRGNQELLEDEVTVCNMIANLTAGFLLVIPSIILLIIELM